MKKNINIKYIVIVFILFFLLCPKSESLTYGGCEYSEISRLKSMVSNVNLSYDYYMSNNDVRFSVIISNLVPGFYFVDSQTGIEYTYENAVDGEIVINNYKNTSGNYKFYASLEQCYGVKLGNKYYTFPDYNYYYNDPLCKENSNFSLCQKWVKVTYSYSEFKKVINEYNQKKELIPEEEQIKPEYNETFVDLIIKIYIKYYYLILIGIIVVCVVIMYINKKKNSFDL